MISEHDRHWDTPHPHCWCLPYFLMFAMIDNSSIREGECSFCKESCDKMHKEMTLGCESTAMTSLAPGQLLYRPHCQREELMGPLPGTAQETVDALVCCTSP